MNLPDDVLYSDVEIDPRLAMTYLLPTAISSPRQSRSILWRRCGYHADFVILSKCPRGQIILLLHGVKSGVRFPLLISRDSGQRQGVTKSRTSRRSWAFRLRHA